MSTHDKPVLEETPTGKRVKTADAAANGTAHSTSATSSTSAAADAQAFICPADWPKPGPIDLATADLPHDSSDTEVSPHTQATRHAAAADGSL